MAEILVVDDDKFFLILIEKLINNIGHKVCRAESGEKALGVLKERSFDLMISDVNMKPMNGLELLSRTRSLYPDLEVIVLTSHATLQIANEAMTKGAFDYLTKPLDVEALALSVKHALDHCSVKAENRRLRAEMDHLGSFEGLVAQSGSMCNICNSIASAAPSDINLFLYGEEGTSKDRIARTLHRSGPRKSKPFHTFNCARLSSQQIEFELFGYEKGAFKWAESSKQGLFELTDGGTLFIDEISSMPIDMQDRLIEVMKKKEICKVGGTDSLAVDVRIIASSSRDIEPLVEDELFRKELYHDLCALRIDIPPLRDRPEDILPLVDQILREESGTQSGMMDVDVEAEKALSYYSWPCNERELEGAIGYARAVAQNSVITKDSLPAQIVKASEDAMLSHGAPGATGKNKGHFFRAFLYDKNQGQMKQIGKASEEKSKDGADKITAAKRRNIDMSDVNWIG